MDVLDPTAWDTLVFVVPLIVGMVLVAGLAFGFAGESDGHAHVDAHAHVGHDLDHDLDGHHGAELHAADGHATGAGLLSGMLSVLGVGRVPLTIVLLSLSLLFGATGISSNALLRPLLGSLTGFASLAIALLVATLGTGMVARLVARIVPTRESYNVRKDDLVGSIGQAIVELGPDDGFLQVRDHEGNLHQVRARTRAGTVAKGSRVVLVEHRTDGDWYLVTPLDDDPAKAHPGDPLADSIPADPSAPLRTPTRER